MSLDMIEGAVFLHQDDDMFNVDNAAGLTVGSDGKGLGDTARKGSDGGCATQSLQEQAPVN
jgi:hypothetical protein